MTFRWTHKWRTKQAWNVRNERREKDKTVLCLASESASWKSASVLSQILAAISVHKMAQNETSERRKVKGMEGGREAKQKGKDKQSGAQNNHQPGKSKARDRIERRCWKKEKIKGKKENVLKKERFPRAQRTRKCRKTKTKKQTTKEEWFKQRERPHRIHKRKARTNRERCLRPTAMFRRHANKGVITRTVSLRSLFVESRAFSFNLLWKCITKSRESLYIRVWTGTISSQTFFSRSSSSFYLLSIYCILEPN